MSIRAQQGNPIQVVPLYGTSVAIAPAAAPSLTYRGGPLLSNVQVFTIFWGQGWSQSPQSDVIQQLNSYFDYILTSPLIDQLAEYNTPAQTIGHGSRVGTVTITTPDPGQSVSDSAIQTMLQNEIANNTLPQPTANTLYFVYLPSGVTVEQGGSSSCKSFCGYHDTINNGQIY
jgi:hypothetical protein